MSVNNKIKVDKDFLMKVLNKQDTLQVDLDMIARSLGHVVTEVNTLKQHVVIPKEDLFKKELQALCLKHRKRINWDKLGL